MDHLDSTVFKSRTLDSTPLQCPLRSNLDYKCQCFLVIERCPRQGQFSCKVILNDVRTKKHNRDFFKEILLAQIKGSGSPSVVLRAASPASPISLLKMQSLGPYAWPNGSDTLGSGAQQCVLRSLSGHSDARCSLRTTDLEPAIVTIRPVVPIWMKQSKWMVPHGAAGSAAVFMFTEVPPGSS